MLVNVTFIRHKNNDSEENGFNCLNVITFHVVKNEKSEIRGTENNGKRSLDRISVDQNCVLSLDRNFVNHLTKFLDGFQLIRKF